MIPAYEQLSRDRLAVPRLARVWACLQWGGRGVFAVAEQATIAGSNFVANVLLARWLPPAEYGAYAIGFSIFLLVASAYQAVVIEPVTVVGASLYRNRMRPYLAALLRFHVAGAIGMALLLGGGALAAPALGATSIAGTLAGVAIAGPCVLLLWLTRCAAFVNFSARTLTAGALAYAAVMLAAIAALSRYESLSPFSAFLANAAAALAASIVLLCRLRPQFSGVEPVRIREALREHWFYGRWEIGSTVANTLSQNLAYSATAVVLGIAQVGVLRAMLNFALPLHHVNAALRRVAQPHISRLSAERGPGATRGPIRSMSIALVVGSSLGLVAITAFRTQIVDVVYAGKFTAAANELPLLCLAAVLSMVIVPLKVGLRAAQFPASLFVIDGASAAVSLALTIPAAALFGIRGVVVTSVIANAIGCGIGFWLYYFRAGLCGSRSLPENLQWERSRAR